MNQGILAACWWNDGFVGGVEIANVRIEALDQSNKDVGIDCWASYIVVSMYHPSY